jgi:hypothetical protein
MSALSYLSPSRVPIRFVLDGFLQQDRLECDVPGGLHLGLVRLLCWDLQ